MHDLSRRFKALSEEHRLRILALLLRHGEICVCEVERFLDVSQSTASRHLRHLASADLVEARREGQWVYYRITAPRTDSDRLLLDTLRLLLLDIEVPQIEDELRALRAERCAPAAGARGSSPGLQSAEVTT